jgi:hypothetical protein
VFDLIAIGLEAEEAWRIDEGVWGESAMEGLFEGLPLGFGFVGVGIALTGIDLCTGGIGCFDEPPEARSGWK